MPEPVSQRLRLARSAAAAGYRVFPLKPDTKEPATRHGFKDATSDAEQVEAWWTQDPTYGIGLATGMQDNGLWVGVVDVDAKHGGVLAWKQLTRDNGGGWQRHMPIHKTPRAGYHIFGQADPALGLNASNGFPRGIDTRGDGGYVVLPDSRFVDTETGEIGSYKATDNNLWSIVPGAFPVWVIDMWSDGPQHDMVVRHPSTQPVDADSPLAWMKANIDWYAELERDLFTIEADFGGEVRWTRPGKTRGTSLSLHLTGNGCVVVWSENCPEWMVDHRCGQFTRDGHWSLNGFQYICARDHGGDVRAAMSAIRREMMPPPDAAGRVVTTEAGGEPSAVALEVPQLPESFWDRPDLDHIRRAAWAGLAAPDATFLHVATRFATTIHPSWLLPLGGTLDVFGVVIAPSGGAKGLAAKAARRLFPGPPQGRDCKIRMDRTISSGEGLVEGFMGSVKVDDKMERQVVNQATHFIIDEGTTLIAQLGREGSTVIGVLCSAWVGEAIGQQLADGAKTRWIPPHKVRVCSVINIQVALAGELYSPKLRATGFTGRCTFVSGQDPHIPDEIIDDPGPLRLMDWSAPPTYSGQLTYPAEVHATVRAEIMGSHRGTLGRDERQSHRILQRVKWAQILAMMDGRQEMNLDDWRRGGDLVDLSGSMLTMLDVTHEAVAKLESFQRLQTRAEGEAYVEDAKISHAVRRVERWVLARVPSGGVGLKALRRKIDSRDRLAFDEAVDNLLRDGRLLRDADDTLTLP